MFIKCSFRGSVLMFADTAMHAALKSLGIAEKVISVISDIVNNAMKVQLNSCYVCFLFISFYFYFITFFLLKYKIHPTNCWVIVGEPCVCIVSHYSKRKRVRALICSGRKQNSNFIPICCAEQSFHHVWGFKSKDAKQLRGGEGGNKTKQTKPSPQKVFYHYFYFSLLAAGIFSVSGQV